MASSTTSSTTAETRQWKERVCCIGAGYVGGPTMAVIAKHCPDVRVAVVDIDATRIAAWNSRSLPVFEPQLQETIDAAHANGNLVFSTAIDEEIDRADIIFVAVATPTKSYGRGSGKAFDMTYWDAVARNIARVARSDKIIVEKSTVPVRTAEKVIKILNANRTSRHVKFHVVSNPEFLAEGSAIHNLEEPERVLVGGNITANEDDDQDTLTTSAAIKRVCDIYAHWVPAERIITTNLWSSELAKLASNAFLAQRISSINAVSAMCEEVGAEVGDISRVLGMDPRINNKYLSASVGFGGSCLKKDVLALVYICESYQLHEVAEYWKSIVTINEFQKERFAVRILETMYDSVRSKKLGILGFAFKKNTGDTRETCAFEVIRFLLSEGADLHVYDPQVKHDEIKSYFPAVTVHSDPLQALDGAHAIVLLTEWDEFTQYDYQAIYERMNKPAFVFDGRNILPFERLVEIGFSVHAIGRRSPHHHRFGFH